MAETVAESMVGTLHAAGVRRVYGIVGDSLNGFTDALRRRGDMRWVHTRHEEAAAFAAGADAQLTGELAACAGSCGPGNMHLINGLYDAHRSRAPVLAIAAQVPTAEVGRGYFQETDPKALFRDCAHFCEAVTSPAQMPGVFEQAARVAAAKRGVAVVVVSGDVLLERMPSGAPAASPWLRPAAPVVVPAEAELDALAALLNGAGRVTLLCGQGCAGARAPVLRLAEALNAPVVHALRGKEAVEAENPYDVGMTGLIGFSSGHHAMESCDALLMLGTDFPYRQFYPAGAKIAQVDIRPEVLGRRCSLALGLTGDVGATAEALLPRLEPKADRAHLDDCRARFAQARRGLDELAAGEPGRTPMHPQFVARTLSDLAEDDAVFACDVGTPTVWAARYLEVGGRRRLIGSFNHGSMANALPQALGAQAAFPGRQVITLSGDGGVAMLLGDLLTLRQERLPAKVVVFNNGTLGFVELEMKATGFLDHGVALENPDFAALAQAAGIFARRVEDPGELADAVREVLAHDGPALLDAVVARQELVMPPKTEVGQAAGFGLWLMKAVLSGRGDEVVDLVRTNLRR